MHLKTYRLGEQNYNTKIIKNESNPKIFFFKNHSTWTDGKESFFGPAHLTSKWFVCSPQRKNEFDPPGLHIAVNKGNVTNNCSVAHSPCAVAGPSLTHREN